jgi:hypothetical protein
MNKPRVIKLPHGTYDATIFRVIERDPDGTAVAHPDQGGDDERMQSLNAAYAAAKLELER